MFVYFKYHSLVHSFIIIIIISRITIGWRKGRFRHSVRMPITDDEMDKQI